MPGHTHQAYAGDGVAFASQTAAPTSSSYLGREKAGSYAATANTTLAANAVGTGGGNQSHNNQMPTLSMTFCIALVGIYPTRN